MYAVMTCHLRWRTFALKYNKPTIPTCLNVCMNVCIYACIHVSI